MQLLDNTLSPAIAEARLLHPQDDGYFAIGLKDPTSPRGWREYLHSIRGLDAAAQALRGHEDAYISQATFRTKMRKSFNTQSLRCVFVDLDVYNAPGGARHVDDSLIDAVQSRAVQMGLPEPSYIANSGRGLYAKWVFDQPVTASLLPSWKLLQKKIVGAYLPMGADTKVVDSARVLRLCETINSKSRSKVRIVREGQTHAFKDLFQAAAPLELYRKTDAGTIQKAREPSVMNKGVILRSADLVSDEMLTDLDALAHFSASREPVMLKSFSLQSLNWSRFLDLRDIVVSRGGIAKGSRDIILFWMVNFLAHAGVINTSNFWGEIRALLGSFPIGRDFDPLNDGSMKPMLDRLYAQIRGEKIVYEGRSYDPVYTPSNDSLINILQLTSEEERSMRTIISSREKLHRADEKIPGRAARRQEREDLRSAAVALKTQGLTTTQISVQLGRDRSTVHRWLTPDAAAGRPYIETRGRKPQARTWRRPHTILTGLGPVTVTSERVAPGDCPAAELSRRTKVRQQKAHLDPARARLWEPGKLREWLHARQQEQRALAAARQAIESASGQHNEAEQQARQSSLELLRRVMQKNRGLAAGISISIKPSVSSSPETGPPSDNTV